MIAELRSSVKYNGAKPFKALYVNKYSWNQSLAFQTLLLLRALGRYRHMSSSKQFCNILWWWKFLIIALMVEMGMFTAQALFLKPLH